MATICSEHPHQGLPPLIVPVVDLARSQSDVGPCSTSGSKGGIKRSSPTPHGNGGGQFKKSPKVGSSSTGLSPHMSAMQVGFDVPTLDLSEAACPELDSFMAQLKDKVRSSSDLQFPLTFSPLPPPGFAC